LPFNNSKNPKRVVYNNECRRQVLAGSAALATAAAFWPKHLFAQNSKVIRIGG